MNPVELMVYAASWELLMTHTTLELMLAPRGAADAAKQIVRIEPVSREEFEAFRRRLSEPAAPSAEGSKP